jgi:hypothetical protein
MGKQRGLTGCRCGFALPAIPEQPILSQTIAVVRVHQAQLSSEGLT